jgi:LPS-assembly protein
MRTRLFWCITLYLLCHPRLRAQAVTTQFPPAQERVSASLPDDPSLHSSMPEAHVVPQPSAGVPVKIIADAQAREETKDGTIYTLDGNVVLYYRRYIIHADHVSYNETTGEVVAQGHLMVDGGQDDEHFEASHGTINVQQDTGDFFDVVGTLGVERRPRGRMVFTAPNPFAITGREVLQLGKGHYRVIHGTMTSCRLPKPDWRILSHEIELRNHMASATGAAFELFHVPVFYLPYVTHPVSAERQSGILLPYVGNNTTKGFIFGEGFYLTLGRSADLMMATQFYSKRGWAPNGLFRYRGRGLNFGNLHFQSLLDEGVLEPDGKRGANQGGVDIGADGRYDFTNHTTGVIGAEYLSSYVYRLVFEEEYAQAINSEVKSQAFLTHENRDMWTSLRMNRYQDFQSSTIGGDEVRVLHMPQLDMQVADRQLSNSPVDWGFSGSAGALSRHDYPSFRTSAEVPRIDIHPRASLPLHFAGWTFRPNAGIRETWYGKSQFPGSLEQIPTLRSSGTSRNDVEAGFELRPPALERDFKAPWLNHLLGGDVRHTIEPAVAYRYVTGINNFRQILRFDQTDVASNTNEMEYGLTQRLFLRHLAPHPCKGDAALGPDSLCGGGTRDWISWRVAQKYYFEPDFDGAITPGTPNPLDTTLDFTGVDFLTGPRNTTPVISRLQARTTAATNVEWDLDYDVKEGRITSSNVFAGYQHGFYRFQFGDSYMNVPLGVTPLAKAAVVNATASQPDQFNQIHMTAVYGAANKLGLSTGINTAYDLVHQQLQYGAAQGSYNWNCCGLMFQYRRFSLGSIRDDTEYFYSLSLAGISSVGDLRRRISLF